MVGIGFVVCGVWSGFSPICGIEAVRAQWSLWLVVVSVMVDSWFLCRSVGGSRRSQWSSGEFDGR